MTNARLAGTCIEFRAELDPEGRTLLEHAIAELHLSAGSRHRVLRIARTIADLAGAEEVRISHLAEALRFR